MSWQWLIEAGGMLGFAPTVTFAMTLPELLFSLRGWQRAQGLDPDTTENSMPMTRARLLELITKEN